MLGAIFGDIVGSRFEFQPFKSERFELLHPDCRFTDDTVLTLAIAEALLNGEDYGATIRRFARAYPEAGYGQSFRAWFRADDAPAYGSWGNGSAMRVAAIGWWFEDLKTVLAEARLSALPTHDHPDGIAAAQAVAGAIFLARQGEPQESIRAWLEQRFGYNLQRSLADIRPGYGFDVSCAGSVPEALIAFFEADSVEDAVRKAVSLGGDADTQACIAGAVAEACFGPLSAVLQQALFNYLEPSQSALARRFLDLLDARGNRSDKT